MSAIAVKSMVSDSARGLIDLDKNRLTEDMFSQSESSSRADGNRTEHMKHGICDVLRAKMIAYIEPRDQSVRWLSQRVGLPYSSVYRIISREAQNCTFRNAYQVLKVVAPDEAKSILMEYFPSFSPLIDQDNNFFENEEKMEKALDLTLKTKMLYLVYSMASTSCGTSRNEVKEAYGRAGVRCLDLLLEQEVLAERRDGVIKDLLHNTFQSNEDQLRQMIRYNLDSFQAADRYSGIVNLVEGFSEEGAEEIRQLLRETNAKLVDIRRNPAKLGRRRLFVSLLCGQFDAQDGNVDKGNVE